MALARRVGLVQARLRDQHRPIRMPARAARDHLEHRILRRVAGLHDDEHQMRLRLGHRDVGGRIVVGLAEPARIEEADRRRVGWKIEDRAPSRCTP